MKFPFHYLFGLTATSAGMLMSPYFALPALAAAGMTYVGIKSYRTYQAHQHNKTMAYSHLLMAILKQDVLGLKKELENDKAHQSLCERHLSGCLSHSQRCPNSSDKILTSSAKQMYEILLASNAYTSKQKLDSLITFCENFSLCQDENLNLFIRVLKQLPPQSVSNDKLLEVLEHIITLNTDATSIPEDKKALIFQICLNVPPTRLRSLLYRYCHFALDPELEIVEAIIQALKQKTSDNGQHILSSVFFALIQHMAHTKLNHLPQNLENYLSFLIEQGADVNCCLLGSTALHMAMDMQHQELVRYLIQDLNASVTTENAQGKIALDLLMATENEPLCTAAGLSLNFVGIPRYLQQKLLELKRSFDIFITVVATGIQVPQGNGDSLYMPLTGNNFQQSPWMGNLYHRQILPIVKDFIEKIESDLQDAHTMDSPVTILDIAQQVLDTLQDIENEHTQDFMRAISSIRHGEIILESGIAISNIRQSVDEYLRIARSLVIHQLLEKIEAQRESCEAANIPILSILDILNTHRHKHLQGQEVTPFTISQRLRDQLQLHIKSSRPVVQAPPSAVNKSRTSEEDLDSIFNADIPSLSKAQRKTLMERWMRLHVTDFTNPPKGTEEIDLQSNINPALLLMNYQHMVQQRGSTIELVPDKTPSQPISNIKL